MARRILCLALAIYTAKCMEMHETVERMVMVRTTGSDLSPAATGFIYKKDNDGTASVVKMEETEILQHLKKLPDSPLYEQPESFAAPIPIAAGPFHSTEEDENKAASQSKETIIPVVEKVNEGGNNDKIDGIVKEDYAKMFEEYTAELGDYKSDFGDYLHGLGNYGHGLGHYGHDIHHGEHGDSTGYDSNGHLAHGDKGNKGYNLNHEFGKDKAGDYHTEKHESYVVSRGSGDKKNYENSDKTGGAYDQGDGFKGSDHDYKSGQIKSEEADRFRKLYEKDAIKKDQDFYDGESDERGYSKFTHGHDNHGSDAGGHKEGGSRDTGHDESGFGKSGVHEQGYDDSHGNDDSSEDEDEAYHDGDRDFSSKGGLYDGKSYKFEVKHTRR